MNPTELIQALRNLSKLPDGSCSIGRGFFTECADTIERLTQWQSIETAPISEDCIFYQSSYELFQGYFKVPSMMIGYLTKERDFCPNDVSGYEWDCELDRPTHWMPLPTPPQPQEGK